VKTPPPRRPLPGPPPPRARRSHRGFTLAEVLTATGVAALAAAGIFSLLLYCLYRNQSSANTIQHSTYVRNLTQRLHQDIRAANSAEIFRDTTARTYADHLDLIGSQGNYLLLYNRSWEPVSREDRIESVIGYYALPRPDGSLSLYRFEDKSPSARSSPDIPLTTFTGFGSATHHLLADRVTLPDDGQGIFANLKNGGVLVQARFSLPNAQAAHGSRFTLYNFTVSPRG
jgi:hypothetical protein